MIFVICLMIVEETVVHSSHGSLLMPVWSAEALTHFLSARPQSEITLTLQRDPW